MYNCIIREYLNHVDALESHALCPSKKARLGKGSLVLKSVFIESSIDSSIDNTSSFNDSFNDSAKELMEFGQRTLKSGQVLIDLRSVFDTAFPNVKIKAIDRVILGRNKITN
jgi:hypothetical protein